MYESFCNCVFFPRAVNEKVYFVIMPMQFLCKTFVIKSPPFEIIKKQTSSLNFLYKPQSHKFFFTFP